MSIRKILSVCTVSAVTFFSVSCGIKNGEESISSADIQEYFSCSAVIRYNDTEASSTLKRYGKGMWENEFISPDTVAGVKLSFNNDEVTASYKGLEFSVPKSAMPFQSMLCCLIDASDTLFESDDIVYKESDGFLYYSGSIEQGDYKISFDSSTGFIHSFEMPNMSLEMEFTDCTANESPSGTAVEETIVITSSSS